MRPHDVTVLDAPDDGAREAIVERIVRVGHEVRVELALGEGQQLVALLTKPEADELELREGAIVWARPDGVRQLA